MSWSIAIILYIDMYRIVTYTPNSLHLLHWQFMFTFQ